MDTSGKAGMAALMTRARWIEVLRIAVCALVALLYWRGHVPVAALWGAIALGLYPLLRGGLELLWRERRIGTEVFVSVATLVAVLGGETVAGAVVMVIILIAEFIAELNTDRARASIKALIGSVPQTATRRGASGDATVPVAELALGDIVLVRPGEKVPVDGCVVAGEGAVNEAPITGESVPRDKAAGSPVFAGTILEAGALDIRTERLGRDTTFARIVALVEDAESEKAPIQKLADRVAAWLIPVVLVFLVGVYLVTRDIRTVVTLLIFTSPAELGLATPLVMIAAIARAARSGILVKGGAYLEALAKVDVVVFDKTGTLTENRPRVVRVVPAQGQSEDDVLRWAAAADRRSAHPLAKAIVEAATGRALLVPEPDSFEQLAARGARVQVQGQLVLAGNAALLREAGIEPVETGDDGTSRVHVAVDGRSVGVILIADTLRPEAAAALAALRAGGVRRLVMLTGDHRATAEAVARELGIDEVRADLMPQDKVAAIAELKQQGHRVAMVGDGINDAPALARADVGIAMGSRGTEAALEAADVALMTDDLGRIAAARAISRRAYRTVQENLIVGVGVVHVLGIVAGLMGWIGPIEAAVLHLGPDILVFVNSVKLLRVRIDGA